VDEKTEDKSLAAQRRDVFHDPRERENQAQLGGQKLLHDSHGVAGFDNTISRMESQWNTDFLPTLLLGIGMRTT